jgi:hypothetical protein
LFIYGGIFPFGKVLIGALELCGHGGYALGHGYYGEHDHYNCYARYGLGYGYYGGHGDYDCYGGHGG